MDGGAIDELKRQHDQHDDAHTQGTLLIITGSSMYVVATQPQQGHAFVKEMYGPSQAWLAG